MWSFYALAVMLSINFIMTITMFGSTKTIICNGATNAVSALILSFFLWVYWDFLNPLEFVLGACIFGFISLVTFIRFSRDLGKPVIFMYIGYRKFFTSLIFLVGLFLYQYLIK